ncbi:hypothetical protein MMC10_003257 [Thelotrema lepadinum]|nr:hypothetical protein [Thelotrema lepadinum]
MSLPAGFQVGLELTSITAPLGSVLGRMCNLAIADSIKRSGSDIITEYKLAALLGRHRIDGAIKVHFRASVSSSSQLLISRYFDISLHSGAGPSVQEALKQENPALFSLIIQLSLLSFACEHESLAFAITTAVESMLEEAGGSIERAPDYVSLAGTISACRQQTLNFRWSHHFDAVKAKLQQAFLEQPMVSGSTLDCSSTRLKDDFHAFLNSNVILDRSLPFSILNALIRFVSTLQNFPEEGYLELHCSTGFVTVIVWCYYVLGIDMVVWTHDFQVCFGEGKPAITLQKAASLEDKAVFFNAKDRREPLFSLTSTNEDPPIESELRLESKGFIRALLSGPVEDHELIDNFGYWLISKAISLRNTTLCREVELHNLFDLPFPTITDIVDAGTLLFGYQSKPTPDMIASWTSVELCELLLPLRVRRDFSRNCFFALLLAFARVSNRHETETLPLSVHEFRQLDSDYMVDDWLKYQRIPGLGESFRFLSRLLLREQPSEDEVAALLLTSGWGWSIYFDCFSLVDPADMNVTYLVIKPGVPTRRGLRKTRIMDRSTRHSKLVGAMSKTAQGTLVDAEDNVFFPLE